MQSYVELIGERNICLPRNGDAGIDLIANSDAIYEDVRDYLASRSRTRYVEYRTGIKISPSSNRFHGFVFPRSSISNYDLALANGVAVIDSSYQGEIILRFRVIGGEDGVSGPKIYEKGDKIAQLIFFQPIVPEIVFVDSFKKDDTVRGEGGFGSTGK